MRGGAHRRSLKGHKAGRRGHTAVSLDYELEHTFVDAPEAQKDAAGAGAGGKPPQPSKTAANGRGHVAVKRIDLQVKRARGIVVGPSLRTF